MDLEFKYLKEEIPQDLIDECEEMSKDGNTYFIFDKKLVDVIKTNFDYSKDEERDIKIDSIINSDKSFFIGDISFFEYLPSMYSYYDTETKILNKYERYNFILSFIKKIGFISSEWNLGYEYEQSFILEVDGHKLILRLNPNLFINIRYETYDSIEPDIYNGFFNTKLILKSINKCDNIFKNIIRDIKIDSII